jgi:DNA helicase HerA-like ATPase
MATERVWMAAPGSRIGPASDAERQALRAASPLGGKYDQALDRESAYEILQTRAQGGAPASAQAAGQAGQGGQPADQGAASSGAMAGVGGMLSDFLFGSTGPRGGRRDGVVQSVAKSVVRNAANQMVRGLLGSLVGRRR